MEGKRIFPDDKGHLRFSEPGQFGKDYRGVWFASVPTKELMVGNLASHDVVEHEDGTITVSPSILVENYHGQTWHGYLERGVWREV